jgi:sterol desaturase/sphingolipid hydroxylase (fatty acid hydroxylase superfamily)
MRNLKRVAWWLCFLLAWGLLMGTGSNQVQQLVNAHRSVPFYLLLSLLLAIPTSIVTLAVGFVLESLLVGWSRSSLKTLLEAPSSVRLDALSAAMQMLPHRLLSYLLSLGLLYAVDTRLMHPAKISLTGHLSSWGIQVGCLLMLQSLVGYWLHRLEHTIPALWSLHKFHHSADRMSILTADRQTDLTRGLEEIVLLSFLTLSDPTLPPPSAASPLFVIVVIHFMYRTFVRVNQYLCHSNLSTDYGWIGRWLIVSPRMHRLHHAKPPEYHNKNFTFDLVIWDRLFGTYAACDARAADRLQLGLEESPFNSGRGVKSVLRDYFITSYVVFWRSLRQGIRAWLPAR